MTEPAAGAGGITFIDAEALDRALPMAAAVNALEQALLAGLDPAADPPRTVLDVAAGHILLMPAADAAFAGVKVATVAPANPDRGLPRVHASYLLLDGATLAPVALLDGTALTSLRTPATSALAVRHLAPVMAGRLLIIGTGPQAWGHVHAMRAVRPITRVDVAGRDAARLAAFVTRLRDFGVDAHAVPSGETLDRTAAAAEVICCCTTARQPLFDSAVLAAEATVVAVGSHEPGAREVDERLVAAGTTVVESLPSALAEAGDVIAAIEAGVVTAADLVGLDALVRGEAGPTAGRPRLFKSTGMAWEDLVVAVAAYRSLAATRLTEP